MCKSEEFVSIKINYIKQIIYDALKSAEKSHSILFKDSFNKQNELIATTYLNKAISLISTAKAIYISNIEKLEKAEVENIFHTFDVFESEFLENLSSNHSHQWTDIEFQKFKESVESFIQI